MPHFQEHVLQHYTPVMNTNNHNCHTPATPLQLYGSFCPSACLSGCLAACLLIPHQPGFGGAFCTPCTSGTYSPGGSIAECRTCPSGINSLTLTPFADGAAAVAPTDCACKPGFGEFFMAAYSSDSEARRAC
jgi:hypothetical protein